MAMPYLEGYHTDDAGKDEDAKKTQGTGESSIVQT